MRWPGWARAYGTALMLNIAIVGELPPPLGRPGIGIERTMPARRPEQDERERAGPHLITLPYVIDAERPGAAPAFSQN